MPRLPIFPLRVVLFPGMLLPLHIFEERYKLMINQCLEEKSPFGIALASGHARMGAPSFYRVGTMAHITEVDRLAEGRMNISVLGRQRFEIRQVIKHQPYLLADADLYPMNRETAHERQIIEHVLAKQVHRLLKQYTHLLLRSTGSKVDVLHLPSAPSTLAFLAAIVLQVSLELKQELLEMPSYYALLRREEQLLHRENALLGFILETQREQEEDQWPPLPDFSPN